MVMSARNTGASIRPMMGSVFAAQQYAGAQEALEVHEEVVSRDPPKHSVTPRLEKRRAVDNLEPVETEVATPAAVRTEEIEQRTSFKPLVERASPEESERPASHSAGGAQRHAVSEVAEVDDPPQLRSEATEQKVAITSLLKPLVGDQNHREVSQLAAARPGRRDPTGLPARSERFARQQDEIHINIGRIEVTAAPPAQVRTAPKPAHKSLDLAAYLKRRDGSGR
jgi:hypothetical protein